MSRLSLVDIPAELPIKINFVRSLYHNPDIFKDFGRLAMRVHSASHLSARIRELAVLNVISSLGAAYEWANHVPAARDAGITDDQIRAIRAGDFGGFDGTDLMALRFAHAVEGRSVDDALWAEARVLFSEVELVDLTLVAAFYGFASRCVLAFDVPADPGAHGFELP